VTAAVDPRAVTIALTATVALAPMLIAAAYAMVLAPAADTRQAPAWARRSLAGEVVHHAPSRGRRPNADAIGAAIDMRGCRVVASCATDAAPETEQPAPYGPSTGDLPDNTETIVLTGGVLR
jgi:hypothetical protein